MKRLFLSTAVLLFLSGPLAAAGPEEGLFNAAKTMIANAQSMSDEDKIATYQAAKDLLDLVKMSYGTTEIGQGINSEEVVNGIDVSALNKAVQNGSVVDADPVLVELGDTILTNVVPEEPVQIEEVAETPVLEAPEASRDQSDTTLPAPLENAGNSYGQLAALAPPVRSLGGANIYNPFNNMDSKEIMRLTQSALNDLQCNVGSPDGVAGRKTRAGYRSFLKAKGFSEGGMPLGSAALLEVLQGLSGRVCEPPKAIPLGPSNIAGQWSYRSKCGARSKFPNKTITGALALAHRGGGNYAGRIKNSQGLIGDISIRLSGRSVQGTVNWGFFFGRTSFSGSVAKEALVLYGRDSLGCRMTVRKR